MSEQEKKLEKENRPPRKERKYPVKDKKKDHDSKDRTEKKYRENKPAKEFKAKDKGLKEEKVQKEVKVVKEEKNNQKEVVKSSTRYEYIAFVSFKESKKIYTFGTNDATLKINDAVVVETVRGIEVGTIMKENRAFCEVPSELEIKPILRKATEKDLADIDANVEAAKEALKVCEEAINKLGLDMHLIEAEYTLDRSKIIFVYVADDRVDFRELLKDLATKFKCRIELRQIGPRNKAKIVGGLGSCGMETCCSRFLNDFDVVSINMAKNQLLALNVQKLSGQCGKLMCCLKYEDAQYKEMRDGLPKINSQIEYKGSRYRVTSLNVLLKQAKIENKEDVQFLDFSELWPDIDWSKR